MGWLLLAKVALRVEQSSNCTVNAVVPHTYASHSLTLVCKAVSRDENPNPARQRPRPVWCVFDGLMYPVAPLQALGSMLSGEEGVQCNLRDTGSRSGDPSTLRYRTSSPARTTFYKPPSRPTRSINFVSRTRIIRG